MAKILKFIIVIIVGTAVLFLLSVKDGQPLFSSKNFSMILGILTFYATLYLWKFWRRRNNP
ncbi:hypothetical protein [Guptibacillus spartinae]|uniref:hypothetical protein n=1 Tax=Guptibacillus spartinae TaxID=3025679 RepID=UPI0023600019|nr:hypothetical protein [Pseudalkalibacillus spartinae]